MTDILYLEMLEFMRPAGSVHEEAFINRYIKPLNPREDTFGNFIVDIGENPHILWSSHTDTVHRKSGFQRVVVDKNRIVRVKFPTESNCLGADCTTGIYIMIEMIKAKVPGRYVFHREEEVGLRGANFIAKQTPELLKGIKAAIAFDRKGTKDIITHMGHQTCSNNFAESLALALELDYKPSSNGMGTDTKNYTALVPECTNISVGYTGQHTSNETQDLKFLRKLVDRMTKIDVSALVFEREPKEPYTYQPPVRQYGGYQSYQGGYKRKLETVYDLCADSPHTISRLLMRMGWDFETLEFAMDKIRSIPYNDHQNPLWDDAVSDDGHKLPKGPKKSKSDSNQKVRSVV
jgi:hypothetical protein